MVAAIIIGANGRLNYYLLGTMKECSGAANLLLYKVALWGYEYGYKIFHLGGGVWVCEDSLFHFKSSFCKGEPTNFYIGRKIFMDLKYYELVLMRNESIKSQHFSKISRMISG